MPSVVERVWQDESLVFRAARAGLTPLSWAFGAVTAARSALYDRGVIPAQRSKVPVVSVGNLRVGGTGKTPLVIWLAERLGARGRRVVVASRGHGAGRATTVISTDDEPVRRTLAASGTPVQRVHVRASGQVDGEIAAAADEALLVALRTGRPVVTAVDRFQACRLAELAFAPDLIVLDDGFQHRRLRRDIDIVVLGQGDRTARLLPAGPLRESPQALLRADVVIAEERSTVGPYLLRSPVGLVEWPSAAAAVQPVVTIRGRRVAAVAGIARTEEFVGMLVAAGAQPETVLRFSDHHRYDDADWARILRAADEVDVVVTTEKDLVKLARFNDGAARLVALRIEVEVEGGEALLDLICARAT